MEGCLYLLLTSYYQLRSRFEEGSWRGGLLERVKTLSCCAPDWEACKRGGRGGGPVSGGKAVVWVVVGEEQEQRAPWRSSKDIES